MNTLFTRLLPLLVAALLAACASTPRSTSRAPTLLLISIDGLRPGDVTAAEMPNLNRLAAQGVRAEGMRPSYPSLTFPNHYTLVTGMRPNQHGLIHNSMYDKQLGEFRLSPRAAVEDSQWWGGEPIWVSAEKAGLRTATMYWPGSEAAIKGIRPRQWQKFDGKTTAIWRAHTVADWLLQPAANRPAFATLYFDKVDHASHNHGPASVEASAARTDTDAAIGWLLDALRNAGELEHTNIVVVSDHGFAEVAPRQWIAIEDMIGTNQAQAHSVGQVITFSPKPGFEAIAEHRLLGRHPHHECWRKADLPARWHYNSHPRIPAIVCQMDEGWNALPRIMIEHTRYRESGTRGSHGYDPALPSMRATFIAHGPAFKPGSRLPVFDNVDVYPLMMELIGVEAVPNDGSVRTFDAVRKGD